MPILLLTLVLAAALGGGVSVASQNAVPGDALYGFKVHVKENIEGVLAFTSEERALWNIRAAQSRLEEASELAAKNVLDATAQAQLAANFEIHAANVEKQIAALQTAGQYRAAADIAARFQSTLAAHLSLMTQAGANAQDSLASVVAGVRGALNAASSLSARASAKAATDQSSTGAALNVGADIGSKQ